MLTLSSRTAAVWLTLSLFAEAGATLEEWPTWSDGVSEIVQRHCVECHRQAGPAPMPLTDFSQARPWAKAIRRAVELGSMPPWHAVAGGPFANQRGLEPEERRTLLDWVSNGAPEGRGGAALSVEASGEWLIGTPDRIIELPSVDVPALGEVPYHDVVVDPGFTEDVWIRAAEAKPGNREVVHHIIVGYRIEDPLERHRLARAGVGHRVQGNLGGYVPGDEPMMLADGLARKIPAGSKLHVQIHYTPNGAATRDTSRVAIAFAERPPKHEVLTGIASNPFISIPPGSTDTSLRAAHRFLRDSVVLSMRPHMHLRGETFTYTARFPDGTERLLLEVDDYDFGWQTNYVLAEPLAVPAGTELVCEGRWDNSSANADNPDPMTTVSWGQQTSDEMMIGFFEYYER